MHPVMLFRLHSVDPAGGAVAATAAAVSWAAVGDVPAAGVVGVVAPAAVAAQVWVAQEPLPPRTSWHSCVHALTQAVSPAVPTSQDSGAGAVPAGEQVKVHVPVTAFALPTLKNKLPRITTEQQRTAYFNLNRSPLACSRSWPFDIRKNERRELHIKSRTIIPHERRGRKIDQDRTGGCNREPRTPWSFVERPSPLSGGAGVGGIDPLAPPDKGDGFSSENPGGLSPGV